MFFSFMAWFFFSLAPIFFDLFWAFFLVFFLLDVLVRFLTALCCQGSDALFDSLSGS